MALVNDKLVGMLGATLRRATVTAALSAPISSTTRRARAASPGAGYCIRYSGSGKP